MSVKKTVSRVALVGATAILALGGLAGQANASYVNIDSWHAGTCASHPGAYFCLFYNSNHGGGIWTSNVQAVPSLSGNFSDGNPVKNDAASAENASACDVGIWVNSNYMGDENWLSPGMGGNLNSWLKNNEASIAMDDATRSYCPTVG
ncbi:peptidase inhibitor family I36 protein [Kitasatospora sp. RB6PN24]|uniref:peptidase inhibitor family I36 protein n=1 Tax=Kitasatospora humi TaxID=2893891 RepID=UPI001E4C7E7C|nr:peptidase inhibitor family I36 protein [Kitasatospora humi]MCC9311455.1 peptidase inhibitor family I36 protein [Kitasatospora humi]